ncbi:uncharacterized protein LOC126616639 [Malus sylvestris]|uniref:uncharacterized protein LOC126616639 n=1 Tax=Malus sylvestris TaxID=3752 RepID=UPI0021AD38EA|nr:uncharacterized protein LOC126616639 [Malus sylvestris]
MDIEHQETRFPPLTASDQERKPAKILSREEMESNNEGMFVTLKVAKPEPLGQNPQNFSAAPLPEFTRFCEVCFKGFSSGKALGGHKRMHVQANRELFNQSRKNTISSKPNNSKPSNSNVGSSNAGGVLGIGGNSSTISNMKPVCCVCGKNFPSMKSLFGHMRSHPEREWRGIQPPPTAKNSSSSTVSDAVPDQSNRKAQEDQIESDETFFRSKSSVLNLSKTLPKWSQTARRGRKSGSTGFESNSDQSVSGLDSRSPRTVEEDEEQMEEAVHDLLMLAQANPLEGGGADETMYEVTNSNFLITTNQDREGGLPYHGHTAPSTVGSTNKRKGASSEVKRSEKKWYDAYGGGFGQEKSTVKNFLKLGLMEEENIGNYNNMEDELSDSQNSESIAVVRRKRRKMKLVDLEGRLRYKCNLCAKCFPSHQALGGHMSSHNKLKGITVAHSSMEDQSASADDPAAEDRVHGDEAERVALDHLQHHQCKICNKTFPTGQALGGHKRCHWTGPTEQQQQQVVVVGPSEQLQKQVVVVGPSEQLQKQLQAHSSQTIVGGRGGGKVLNFDLNELPPMEEDNQEGAGTDYQYGGAAAAGCSTSSYNSVTN